MSDIITAIMIKNMARETVKQMSATVKNAGKSPWMMRLSDWLKYEAEVFGDKPKEISERSKQWHKGHVLTALKEGKRVPEEVLKDYPDLRR